MDLLNLAAKLTLDSSEYNRGLDSAGEKADALAGKLKSGLAFVGKAAVAGIAATGAAVAGLTKKAIEGYADFEQLVGGIETLYEDLSVDIGIYADRAYKTAGMSANEYMETAIGFAAALNNSLMESEGNISRSAELTDQIIIDMSDNVNKMGTSMEAVQNAYRGFSRGNFTMLDNLALGFSGSAEGMQKLLDKAEELSGVKYDISSFADITEAIHVVQEEMGIAGTTAREASETISGSLSSVRSAWQNLVVGMADENADIGQLVTNFADSVGTAAGNLLPRIQQSLEGIGKVVQAVAPVIAQALPTLVQNVLPSLLSTAASLLLSFGEAIIDGLPVIIDAATQAVMALGRGIVDALPKIIPKIGEIIKTIVDVLTDPGTLSMLVDSAISIIMTLADGLLKAVPKLINRIPKIIDRLVNGLLGKGLPAFLDAGVRLFTSIVEALPKIISNIVAVIPTIINKIVSALKDAIPMLVAAGIQLLTALVGALPDIIAGIVAALPVIIDGIISALSTLIPLLIEAGVQLFIALVQNLPAIIAGIVQALPEIIAAIINGLAGIGSMLAEVFSDAWEGIKEVFAPVGEWFSEKFQAAKEGIMNAWSNIKEKFSEKWERIKEAFSATKQWFSDRFSEAKEKAASAWSDVKQRFSDRWEDIKAAFKDPKGWFKEKFEEAKSNVVNAWSNIKALMSEIWERIKSSFKFGDALQWGKDMIQNFIDGITAKWRALKEKVASVANTVKSFLGFSEPEQGPLSDFHTYAPDMMMLFAKGIKDNERKVTDQLKKSFDFDRVLSMDAYAGGARGGYDSQSAAARNYSINVTINGAEGQDVRSLADLVAERISFEIAKKEAALA